MEFSTSLNILVLSSVGNLSPRQLNIRDFRTSLELRVLSLNTFSSAKIPRFQSSSTLSLGTFYLYFFRKFKTLQKKIDGALLRNIHGTYIQYALVRYSTPVITNDSILSVMDLFNVATSSHSIAYLFTVVKFNRIESLQ